MTDESDDGRWAGAPPDEQFEATLGAEEEGFDQRAPHVLTLLGAIPPAALGPTLFTASWPLPGSAPEVAVAELEAAYALGVRAVAFLATEPDERGDERQWVAARSPVHLIAAALTKHASLAVGIVPRQLDAISAKPGPGTDVTARNAAEGETSRPELRVVTLTPHRAQPGGAGPGAPGYVVAVGVGPDYAAAAMWLRDRWRAGEGERLLAGFHDDPVTLMERLPLALMAAGMPALAVREILVDNPMAALTIAPAGES